MIAGRPDAPRRHRGKRLVFAGLTLILVMFVIEGLSWLTLSALMGRAAGWSAIAARRSAVARDAGRAGWTGEDTGSSEEVPPWAVGVRETNILHPYLGFVVRTPPDLTSVAQRYRPEAADLGFPYNLHPLVDLPSPERLIVAVVGGSVAQQVACHGRPDPLLDAALESLPRFRGRDVWVLNLAAGGYKQPQQLMVVTYLLSLGAHFDVVVNLDGFNEVTLPIRENLATGVNPFFPRAWRYRVGNDSRAELDARGAVVFIDELRARWASAASRQPWRSSFTASLVWWLVDRRLHSEANLRQAEVLSEEGHNQLSLERSGPSFVAGSNGDVFEALVGYWKRCSEDLELLTRAHGIEYYHFLQPNQYDPGSKRLTAEERRLAYDPSSDFVELVAAGYPRLRAAGVDLAESGITFVDLSGEFTNVEDTVFIDTCCHLNRRGIELVVQSIADTVSGGPNGRR